MCSYVPETGQKQARKEPKRVLETPFAFSCFSEPPDWRRDNTRPFPKGAFPKGSATGS